MDIYHRILLAATTGTSALPMVKALPSLSHVPAIGPPRNQLPVIVAAPTPQLAQQPSNSPGLPLFLPLDKNYLWRRFQLSSACLLLKRFVLQYLKASYNGTIHESTFGSLNIRVVRLVIQNGSKVNIMASPDAFTGTELRAWVSCWKQPRREIQVELGERRCCRRVVPAC